MDKYNIITPKDNIPDLEKEMISWLQLPTKMKFRANDDCIRLHGCTVTDYYNFIKIGLINAEDKARAEVSPSNIVTVKEEVQWSNADIYNGLRQTEQIMQNPYIIILTPNNNHEPELGQIYNNYLNLNSKNRRLSDYYSVEIWGVNVRNMYELLKASDETFKTCVDMKLSGEDQSNIRIVANAESVVSAIYDAYNKIEFEHGDLEEMNKIIKEFETSGVLNEIFAETLISKTGIYAFDKEKLYLPKYCPWFTLEEMRDMGFDGTIPVNMTNNDWKNAVIKAYNEYQEIPTINNERAVLELGWNPHVEPTESAFAHCKVRQSNFVKYYYNKKNIPVSVNEMTFKDLNYVIMQPMNEYDTDTLDVKRVCYDFKINNKN